MRILIVEDDIAIQETLKELLCMKGYQVQQAYHMKEALLLDKSHIDVMIIDIQLPDGNGITLCQQMRQQSQIPILFLTAKDDEQTIMRRIEHNHDIIQTNDLSIDIRKYRVMKNNQEIVLSAIGYEILFLIVQNQGMVITRERMIEFIEEKTGNYIEDNTVSVHMKRLREKLGQYQQQEYIETVRGIGYRWKNI